MIKCILKQDDDFQFFCRYVHENRKSYGICNTAYDLLYDQRPKTLTIELSRTHGGETGTVMLDLAYTYIPVSWRTAYPGIFGVKQHKYTGTLFMLIRDSEGQVMVPKAATLKSMYDRFEAVC